MAFEMIIWRNRDNSYGGSLTLQGGDAMILDALDNVLYAFAIPGGSPVEVSSLAATPAGSALVIDDRGDAGRGAAYRFTIKAADTVNLPAGSCGVEVARVDGGGGRSVIDAGTAYVLDP